MPHRPAQVSRTNVPERTFVCLHKCLVNNMRWHKFDSAEFALAFACLRASWVAALLLLLLSCLLPTLGSSNFCEDTEPSNLRVHVLNFQAACTWVLAIVCLDNCAEHAPCGIECTTCDHQQSQHMCAHTHTHAHWRVAIVCAAIASITKQFKDCVCVKTKAMRLL